LKECNICNIVKPLSEFYAQEKESRVKGKYIYYYPYCKLCAIVKSDNWAKSNPERRKELLKRINAKPKKKQMVKKADKSARNRGLRTQWRRKNKDKLKIYNIKHTNHLINDNEWESCLEYFNWSCAYCGYLYDNHVVNEGQQLHKDHVNHNGNDYIDNCAPACRTCNTSKHDKEFTEWYNNKNPNFTEKRLEKIIRWTTVDWDIWTI
jgi:hypothetical protein